MEANQMAPSTENIAEISLDSAIIGVGRSSGESLRLLHPTVSRRHATLQRQGSHILVTDLDSRYGTFVNGVRIATRLVDVGDKIQFGTTVVYRVTKTGLRFVADPNGIALSAERIGVLGDSGAPLITDVSFFVPSDSFLGILGPSGSGKSTLLNCLSSQREPQAGHICFDQQPINGESRSRYREMLGYVPQKNIVFDCLTARENLLFAGKLRLGADQSAHELKTAINETLEKVGLGQHANKLTSKLSGGQKRRLNVAIELLRNPRLLILDEPTSGLDPASESQLMEQLRFIASRGTTVVCTTHLMENISLLDTVIVLGVKDKVGRLAYHGPPQFLLQHFECHRFADVYEILEEGKFAPVLGNGLVETDFQLRGTDRPPVSNQTRASESQPLPSGRSIPKDETKLTKEGFNQLILQVMEDGIIQQSMTLFHREMLMISRDKALAMMMVAQPIVLGLIVCLTQFDMDYPTPIYFFSSVLAVWLGLNNSARDLVRQRSLYVRERLAGLRPGAYLSAKFGVFATIGLVQVCFLLLVLRHGSWLVQGDGRHPNLVDISDIIWLTVMLLSYLGGLGMGFITSCIAKTEESAVAAIPLLIIPQLLLSVVAIGAVNNKYDEARPLRPIVVTLRTPSQSVIGDVRISGYAKLVDLGSMFLFTRPATLSLDGTKGRIPKEFSRHIWWGDLCHLIILVCLTWVVVYETFLRCELDWPRQVKF